MVRRPPRYTRSDTHFPTRRSSDLQIVPEVRFDPHGDIRPPMIEKTAHPGGAVDRDIMMEGARGQPLGEQGRRTDRAGGDHDGEVRPLGQQPFDQAQQDRKRTRLNSSHSYAYRMQSTP